MAFYFSLRYVKKFQNIRWIRIGFICWLIFLLALFTGFWKLESRLRDTTLAIRQNNARLEKIIGDVNENKGYIIQKSKIMYRGGEDLKFDQPWRIAPAKIYSNFEDLDPNQRYIFSNFSYSPGLGNLMFQFAALRAFAEKYEAILVIPSDCLLRRAFQKFNRTLLMGTISVDHFIQKNSDRVKVYPICCQFYAEITLFNNSENFEIITGYFQSYRYFHPELKNLIQNEFQFLKGVQSLALNNLENAKFERIKSSNNSQKNKTFVNEDFFYVGIHVRQGIDVTWNSRNLRHGHVTAPVEFYKNAIKILKEKFKNKNLVFIVASDNEAWAQKHIKSNVKGEIFYLKSGHREIDLATLAFCNASIFSTGTFSWWSVYLRPIEGKEKPIIGYGSWPRVGSELAIMVNLKDYFLPEWQLIY